MSDANINDTNTPQRPNFPFWTVAAAFVTFFAFLVLMWFAYQSSSPLAAPPAPSTDTKTEPKIDPTVKLDEVKARNQAALDGVGAKMPVREAHGKLLGTLKGPNDKLPFPTPEPPVVAVPADKKDNKKDEKKDAKDEGKKP